MRYNFERVTPRNPILILCCKGCGTLHKSTSLWANLESPRDYYCNDCKQQIEVAVASAQYERECWEDDSTITY